MKRFFLYSIIFLIYSCDEKEIPIEIESIEIKDRETLSEINEVMAFLDVERIGKDFETSFAFMLEFQDSQGPKYLHVSDEQLICSFLNEQMMYGSLLTSNCAGLGYFYRYLYSGSKSGNYRIHVNIGGKIKEKFSYDLFAGEPFVLENITKIPSCPVTFETRDVSPSLENNFWQLQGFLDEKGDIQSFPTCEDPIIGVFFHGSLIFGDPIDIPGAKSFEIRTEVSILPSLLLSVYSLEEGKIKISRALNPGWMPPKPPTVSTNNFLNLTVDIKNKYDSLDLILRIPNEIEYSITQNMLLLYNPVTQIRARFFLP